MVPSEVGDTSDPAPSHPSRIVLRSARFVQALRPIRQQPVLGGHQVLAGYAIQREEVSVARRRQHQLPHLAVEHRRPPEPAFAPNRSRAYRAAKLRNTRPSCRCPRSPPPARRRTGCLLRRACRWCRQASDCPCRRYRDWSPDRRRPGSTFARRRAAPRRCWPRSLLRDRPDSSARCTSSIADRPFRDRRTGGIPAHRCRCPFPRAHDCPRQSEPAWRNSPCARSAIGLCQRSLPVFASSETR